MPANEKPPGRSAVLAAGLLLTAATWPLASATLAQAPGQATGVIFGRVVEAGTDRGIAGAVVRLTAGGPTPAAAVGPPVPAAFASRAAAAVGPNAITDPSGHFLFRDLPPGAYTVAVQAAGFLPASYGQRRVDGPARAVELNANEQRTDITIHAWRAGALEGTLRDEHGDPVVGAAIRALRRVRGPAGAQFVPAVSANTDDRGLYRLAPLPPGDYVVLAPSSTTSIPQSAVALLTDALTRIASSGGIGDSPLVNSMMASGAVISPEGISVGDAMIQVPIMPRQASAVGPVPTPEGVIDVYRSTFHPAAASVTAASVITLGSGEARTGIDISIALTRALSVSGAIMAPDGPAGDTIVRLLPGDSRAISTDVDFETAMTVSRSDGSFTLLGVPPGDYRLVVLRFGRPAGAPSGELEHNRRTLWGEMPVSVVDRDISGITVPLASGARVQGRVMLEGTQPPSLQRTLVGLAAMDGRTFGNIGGPLPVEASGAFTTFPFPPGRYFINVLPPGPEWVVKSISAGAQSLPDFTIELSAGADVGDVLVTMTNRTATLSGVVRTTTAVPDAVVMLMPAELERWISNGLPPARLRVVAAIEGGAYRFDRLAPGDYLAVGLDAAADFDTRDADTIRALGRAATPVTIVEGADRTVNLAIAQVP
jgi:hypothetical protein